MSDVKSALDIFKAGGFVIVTDDESRENEGDLFLLASKASTERLAFMIRHTSGVICVAMTEARSRQLHLPLMVKHNQDTKRTAFTVTVDVKHGLTTGISAEERANTIRALADQSSRAEDFIRPGHIFPLVAHEKGLAERRGHTEAVVELCRRVGDVAVGVISELVNEDGSMMRGQELSDFATIHQIPIITIEELVRTMEPMPDIAGSNRQSFDWAELPTHHGKWQIASYAGQGGVDHAVIRYGKEESSPLNQSEPVLLRIHSECLTGDVLGSMRCDCGDQLRESMKAIEDYGNGIVIYLREHEGRGIGLAEKIRAYQLQDQGLDTVDANIALGHEVDERDFRDAVDILRKLKIYSVRLLTNNPEKIATLSEAGFEISVQPLEIAPNRFNTRYIQTKRERLGHGGQ